MKKIFTISFLFFLMLLSGIGRAQDLNTQAYSIFTYNFLKYTHWSGKHASGDIKVVFLGSSPVYDVFLNVSKNKSIDGRKITVTKVKTLSEVKDCNLLYISDNTTHLLNDIVKKMSNSGTLIITEREKMVSKGAAISFLVAENKLRFQINDEALATNHIQLASTLRNLAYTY